MTTSQKNEIAVREKPRKEGETEAAVREKRRKEGETEAAGREDRRKELGTEAAKNILGPNPVVGLRGKDLFQTFGMLAGQALRQPYQVLAHGFTFAAEATRILGGASELA